MALKRWVLFVVLGWVATVTFLHLWLNWRVFDPARPEANDGLRFRVGFLPVT